MSDLRPRPTTIKIQVTTGDGVDIEWDDRHASHYDFAYLRDHCPCAVCNDEREKKEKETAKGMAVLPMFKERVKARAAKPVGTYAIQIDFTDGHTTGIYSFDYLRLICPCAACTEEPGAVA